MELETEQTAALRDQIERIVVDSTGEAGAYAAEFARYSAALLSMQLARPEAGGLERLEAMARTVAETLEEIGDRALEKIVARLLDVAQVLFAVLNAAPI